MSKGYEVHGIIRTASTTNTSRIDHIDVDPHTPGARLFLHYGDLVESGQLSNVIRSIKPDEVYHLGAQSHVGVSFDMPEYTGNVTALGTIRMLKMILTIDRKIKFYQASSSEIFGASPPPQNENTPFKPLSPYACAKAYAYWIAVNYRESYHIPICNGILFNHESPGRGETFLTKKISRAVAGILSKRQEKLYLGNLEAKRDWGYAPEYVEAMWRILQQAEPDDFVIGTGESHSVREFLEEAFNYVKLDYCNYVESEPRYSRPMELDNSVADARKAKTRIGWEPRVKFKELVRIMIDADMRNAGLKPVGEGDQILKRKFPSPWWKLE